MTHTLIALLGYALLTVLLVSLIIGLRVVYWLSGKKAINGFAVDGSDISAFSHRLARAHANCYENLPVAAAVLLTALILGLPDITEGLAFIFLGARLAQSLIHLISTKPLFVFLRAGLQGVQIAILIYWIICLIQAVI